MPVKKYFPSKEIKRLSLTGKFEVDKRHSSYKHYKSFTLDDEQYIVAQIKDVIEKGRDMKSPELEGRFTFDFSRKSETKRDYIPSSSAKLVYDHKKVSRINITYSLQLNSWKLFRLIMKTNPDIFSSCRRPNIGMNRTTVVGLLPLNCNNVQQKQDESTTCCWVAALKLQINFFNHFSLKNVSEHGQITYKGLKSVGIAVATGEHCHNRVMFKQFLKAKAMQYCQIDACRLGGVNECLAVILMAAKFNIPVCPHAGGVGLCELVQHLSIFDFISAGCSLENRMIEFADHLHEHMEAPVKIKNGNYVVPTVPGYLVGIKEGTIKQFEYPCGSEWQRMFADGTFEPDV
ncbi:L-fuconate dehydratase [Mytilus galloprovincialis]|uniref:L-fuconate dehydratase n=1 Tax=Mytilus galloprovincialis TaxID=29158 RepID=A0A8B6E389_MYTGA|nr:L-fuconate dehydratase [Mytilus galloprovincialis]